MSDSTGLGFAFDAAVFLGLGTPSAEPLPLPEEDTVIVRIPQGLSFQRLCDWDPERRLIHSQLWYRGDQAHPPGVYRLRLPVPGSSLKTFAEQQGMLPEGEQVASLVLVAAVLLFLHKHGLPDPLEGKWTRCAEAVFDGTRQVELAWLYGRLYLRASSERGDHRIADICVSSSRII